MNTGQGQPQPNGTYWNPSAWTSSYNAARSASNDNDVTSLNMSVAKTTIDFLNTGFVTQEIWAPDGVGAPSLTTIRAPGSIPQSRRVDCIEPMRYAPRFPHTTVHVVNMDCITAMYHLQNMYRDSKCACLNMANQFSCGGGWLNGKLAQEESLFLRTNISRGLSQIKYPLSDYTSVFTSDVAVLRESYQRGYEFRSESGQFRINVVTAAAFNLYDNRTQKDIQFTDKLITETRLKIESFFALCANENASVLALGAFGCGAFRNPPFIVANLFKSVIEQYAGYFQEITFCIADNPTSEKVINFSRVLVDPLITVVPEIYALDPTIPYKNYPVDPRFRPNPSPPDVLRKPVCIYGSVCSIPDRNHFMNMIHPNPCPYGDQCNNIDAMHIIIYTHFGSKLHSQLQSHFQSQPQCQQQPQIQQQPHPQSQYQFQHPNSHQQPQPQPKYQQQSQCQPPTSCQQSKSHCGPPNTDKRTPSLCREPFMCNIALNRKDPNFAAHTRDFMHICRFGSMCKDNSEEHLRYFYHMKKTTCKYGQGCKELRSPKHRFEFFHNGLTDFMLHCGYNPCNKRHLQDHMMNCYHHQEQFVPSIEHLKRYKIELKLLSPPKK